MNKDEDKKNKNKEHENYSTTKKMSREIHEKLKKLDPSYIKEKLQKYGFSDADDIVEKMLKDKE